MISGLDHVVVLVEEIGKGAAAYQTLLGCAPSWRSSARELATSGELNGIFQTFG